ncbi:MAG TPA: endonuclease [Draconibacterium sp.]|nr:endonuclease [Draconibacterium sp.]
MKKKYRAIVMTLIVMLGSVLIAVVVNSFKEVGYSKKRNITVVFYNVENLFDTKNTPGGNDAEFTPEGKNEWTQERYQKKVEDISKVLASVNKKELPELIGLCEIENREVLNDLVKTKFLLAGNYKIEQFESPDFRGIDCVLLFRPDEFKVIKSSPVKVVFDDDLTFTTRDILYVKGETNNGEEFHIFVNHWPSRIGGLEQTEPKRIAVAKLLKSKIDSVQNVNPDANILVMGDMNDEPSNKSLSEILQAKSPEVKNVAFVNLMYPIHNNKQGSYNYRGNWNMLDNIVVSSNLLDKKGFQCKEMQGFVFHEKWMEYENKGEMSPNRTYGGPNYYGGVSDHFPVYVLLKR